MKFEIERIETGHLLTVDGEKYAYDDFIDVLRIIQGLCGEDGSRHDEKRIYLIEAPGDKHEKFTEAHSKVIWGEE